VSRPAPPGLSYDEAIAQLAGADWVPTWRTIGRVLANRPGWCFQIVDGFPGWRYDQDRLHVCATIGARRRVMAVFRQVDDDVALNWDYTGARALRSAVRGLERGRDPDEEPLELGPAIDEAILRTLEPAGDELKPGWPIEGAA
jgi:hypothetical protein